MTSESKLTEALSILLNASYERSHPDFEVAIDAAIKMGFTCARYEVVTSRVIFASNAPLARLADYLADSLCGLDLPRVTFTVGNLYNLES